MTRSGTAVVAAVVVLAALPAGIALSSPHLAAAPGLLVLSTTAAALAVGVLAAQPWLSRRRPRPGRRPLHVVLGGVVAALVLAHVGALVIDDPDDAWFAMSPDGPTRARMALIATVLLAAVTVLGVLRRRLGWSGATWRLVHGVLAALVVALGVGHAVLTDGALDGVGTVVLLALGALGLAGAAVQVVRSLRRPRSRPGADSPSG
jgi:DMSO/TMAO reductase YedYZ heme-binding membrane subunit